MKCFVHQDTEAVALCIHCGKALCPECSGKSASGARVCSAGCAASRAARPLRVNSYFLHCLGAVLLGATLFYIVQDLWQTSVFLAFAAIICFRAGLRSGRKALGLTHLYYRTGDALEKTHRFRQGLEEFLAHHAKISENPLTLAQLDAAETPRKAQMLEQAFEEVRKKMGKDFPQDNLRTQAEGYARDLQFCQTLAEDYFERHAKDLKSASGPKRMSGKLFDAHMPLRSNIGWLSDINRKLQLSEKI